MMSQNPYKANEMENDIVLIKVSEREGERDRECVAVTL